ncbi:phage tail tube protein [Cytobacillus firmus]|uniref:phage tail tube protein n=1 Tax=Cytobacillus firmus TaxID=1399 RepID=UPI0018CD4FEC|nr:phage tail tube protein [Cytobacillus firmus]MBG9548514.1 phage portal protein [Cytobacillus firmus]MBG9602937.1 phage portal protein [Cytobacillus firmus]MBG9654878.1 phage portal protein [Cytobacillus firmus]MED1906115.1 phage tail tube protein [Cytobacillus firmus]MED1941530.1 phage tail tube protein [Cytobacillus firmus]
MALDASKVLNGSFGKMYHDGEWLTNVTQAEAIVEIGKEEIRRSGTRWIGHKTTSLTGSGSMTGYKITNDLIKKIAQVCDDTKPAFVTELVMKLDDPENHEGKTWVRLKGVQFDSIPILSYKVGSIVEDETPFTISGYEYLD